MKDSEKATENRLRRKLFRECYFLRKDRARNYSMDHMGGYMIVNMNNVITAGQRFDLELADVEQFLKEI